MPRLSAVSCALLPATIAWSATAVAHGNTDTPASELTERLRTGAAQGADRSGDVRPEALAILDAAAASDPAPLSLADVREEGLAPMASLSFSPPETIRVWRRSLDGSTTSCSGRVDEIPFDQYVRGVLPHEWIPSWHPESLKAGAVAIRTYAAFHVQTGGRYDCAHVDDTTATQVYKDEFLPETDAAVEATEGLYVVDGDGNLVLAEYSAENGDPTEFDVDEPLCSGKQVFGHGRGTCQWGSQRWASDGRSFDWILTHYYPGSSIHDARARLAAVEVGREHPERLVAGEVGEVSLQFENTALEAWAPGATHLVTAPGGRDSALRDASWEGADAPATIAASAASGEVGTFSFSVRAPSVDEPVVYEETFRLAHEGVAFGPRVTLAVEVAPVGGETGGGGAGGDFERGEPSELPADPGAEGGSGVTAPNVFGCQAGPAGGGGFALAPLCAIVLLCGFVTRRRRRSA